MSETAARLLSARMRALAQAPRRSVAVLSPAELEHWAPVIGAGAYVPRSVVKSLLLTVLSYDRDRDTLARLALFGRDPRAGFFSPVHTMRATALASEVLDRHETRAMGGA